jgi:hypothetical protein
MGDTPSVQGNRCRFRADDALVEAVKVRRLLSRQLRVSGVA